MMTEEALKYLLSDNDRLMDIQLEIDKEGDYIEVWCNAFNTGCSFTYESSDYDEDKEEEAFANGQLFCDKHDFVRLCDELGYTELTAV